MTSIPNNVNVEYDQFYSVIQLLDCSNFEWLSLMGNRALAENTNIDLNALTGSPGKKIEEIEYEVTPINIQQRVKDVMDVQPALEEYKKVEALDMTKLKIQALAILSHPAKMQDASVDELMRLVKLVNDRQQLLEGKPQTTSGTLIEHIVRAAEMRNDKKLEKDSTEVIDIDTEEIADTEEAFEEEEVDV